MKFKKPSAKLEIQELHIRSPNVKIFAIPEAVKQKLLRYKPSSKPKWKKEEEIENEQSHNAGILPAKDLPD